MISSKSVLRVASSFFLLATFAGNVAAQESLGISTGPAPSSTLEVDRGGPAFQAVESFTGGTEFAIFNAASTGDVVGFRFTMNSEQTVQQLGVWNGDTQPGGAGLTSDHQVGIWDDTETLIASVTVTPTSTLNGDFRYEAIPQVTLSPGVTYTIGALYTATDDDGYISGPTITFNPEVSTVNAVFPSVGNLGFVFPDSDSPGNAGRLGPNFIFGAPAPPLPESVPVPTMNSFGLLILLLALAGFAFVMFRRRQA